MTYCIIRDGQVTIPSSILRYNGMRGAEVTVEAGYTPWGYVIHINDEGYNVTDYLETGSVVGDFNVLIIDKQGDLYELLAQNGQIARRKILFNYNESTYVRTHNLDMEKHIRTGIYLKHSTEQILRTMSDINVRYRFAFQEPLVIDIRLITATLKEIWPNQPLKPIPSQKD